MKPAHRAPTDPLLDLLGRQVRSLRTARRWSRRELAEAAGMSERYVHEVEAGRANVSVLRLADLARALGVSPAALLCGVDAVPRRRVVALLGLRGAGKSTIGPRLASRLGMPFFELDGLVEAAAGLTLAEIFELHGEGYYRRLERETLARFLAEHREAVLATGGGIVAHPETFDLLARECRLVWLRATPEDHWERVLRQGDRRPMADNPRAMAELRALLREREPLYARAQHVIDTSALGIRGSVDRLVEELERAGGGPPCLAGPA